MCCGIALMSFSTNDITSAIGLIITLGSVLVMIYDILTSTKKR